MIRIRKTNTNDVEKIAKIINATWRFSYKGIIPDSILTRQTYRHNIPHIKNDIEASDKIVLVAVTNSGEIVGMISGGICRETDKNYDGELYALYVLPKHQRKDIGKLLFMNFCISMKEYGFRSMLLWTLKANKLSRNFYEKMGGRVIKEKHIKIGSKNFDVIAYGWPKLLTYDPNQDLINLVNHNSKWSSEAKLEIKCIKSILGGNLVVDIQHIGSTAIPYIKSKAIIDIIIGVTSFDNTKEKLITPLESIGYFFWQDNPDKERLFLVKGLPPFGKKRTHHVHILKYNSKVWNQHIFFRDYLTKHPTIAKEYEALKTKLANKYQQDRESYTQKKKSFIENILHQH